MVKFLYQFCCLHNVSSFRSKHFKVSQNFGSYTHEFKLLSEQIKQHVNKSELDILRNIVKCNNGTNQFNNCINSF